MDDAIWSSNTGILPSHSGHGDVKTEKDSDNSHRNKEGGDRQDVQTGTEIWMQQPKVELKKQTSELCGDESQNLQTSWCLPKHTVCEQNQMVIHDTFCVKHEAADDPGHKKADKCTAIDTIKMENDMNFHTIDTKTNGEH